MFENKYLILGTPYSINDLKYTKKLESLANEHRKDFEIAIIDDEKFLQADRMRKLGYKITEYEDLDSMNQISNFDIILCDIKGVGKSLFGENGSGKELIKEIRKTFPNKYLIVFSGETHRVDSNEYFQMADNWMTKDEGNVEKWSDMFDVAITELLNGEHMWKKIRNHLLENDINLTDILYLESSFVKFIREGNNSNNYVFPPKKIENQIDKHIWNLLSGFAKSATIKLMLEGVGL